MHGILRDQALGMTALIEVADTVAGVRAGSCVSAAGIKLREGGEP